MIIETASLTSKVRIPHNILFRYWGSIQALWLSALYYWICLYQRTSQRDSLYFKSMRTISSRHWQMWKNVWGMNVKNLSKGKSLTTSLMQKCKTRFNCPFPTELRHAGSFTAAYGLRKCTVEESSRGKGWSSQRSVRRSTWSSKKHQQ
jgi:hypothetical protein